MLISPMTGLRLCGSVVHSQWSLKDPCIDDRHRNNRSTQLTPCIRITTEQFGNQHQIRHRVLIPYGVTVIHTKRWCPRNRWHDDPKFETEVLLTMPTNSFEISSLSEDNEQCRAEDFITSLHLLRTLNSLVLATVVSYYRAKNYPASCTKRQGQLHRLHTICLIF